ncbi:hypothetical protein SCB71_21305 (plasmid) [Herbiconiux sp. KACC 21604]|uniref:hypothetical protein n=1 Tax=unclassified Herbiconiux TaxID=2618217 RepID=UPI001492371F|nr:hypothetical protein [Herbiconiux sp. SALV-R1]QJU56284.1 hypothetical protein HL652_21105 [Herbiconiux sp. SALV-R1]WPO88788.1 hypothetical protein SCB71_21305 [Herbiconiux sp. KACC 21604]
MPFVSTFDSIVDSNGAEGAADFFLGAAEVAREDPSGVPLSQLSELNDSDLVDVLEASASAAAEGEAIDLNALSPEAAEAITTGSGATSSGPASVESSVVARSTPPDPWIGSLEYGYPVNSLYGWQMVWRSEYQHCVIGDVLICWTTSWVEVRITTSPGETQTQTDLNFTRWGDEIGNAWVWSRVWVNGAAAGDSDAVYWPVGGTQHWTDHWSSYGKTFQIGYQIRYQKPSGDGTSDVGFRTAVSEKCKEPTPGAYRCKFPTGVIGL